MKQKILGGALAAALGAATFSAPAISAELGDTSEPIKLAINEWTGQHVTTHIAGMLLERIGYEVEYVTAGYLTQFPVIGQGELHASLEIWNNLVDEAFEKEKDAGRIVEIGSLGLATQEGWMYPKYMEEICPGLPDYRALIDCKDALASAETFPNGRIVAYPADWGTRTSDKIIGLELPYTAVPAGSEGALVAEIQSAVASESPLVIEFWGPHWLLAEVDEGWVTGMPEWASECETDPAWGDNPNAVHDCGYVLPAVTKIVDSGFAERWPAAYAFLEAYQVNAQEQEEMMKAIDQDGQELEDVVTQWIASSEGTWKPWVDSTM